MKDLTFHPLEGLPTCDVCGAYTNRVLTERDGDTLRAAIIFACGARWIAHCRGNFKREFPHGDLTPYDRRFSTWTEADDCGNAVEVVRRARS